MKNKLQKVGLAVSMFVCTLMTKVFASISDVDAQTGVDAIWDKVLAFVTPISGLMIFLSVLIIGFELIMKRNKADERTETMTSLLWVGIGALIIGLVGTIAGVIYKPVTEIQ